MSRLKKTFLVGLVALAMVAAIIVIEVSTNSMTIGLMGNAEQFMIMEVRFVQGAPLGDTVKVVVRNAGASTIAIQIGSVNGMNAVNINSGQVFAIPKGTLLEVTLTFPNRTLVYGSQQQIRLVTSKGTSAAYGLTYDATCTSQYDPLRDDVSPTPTAFIAPPPTLDHRQAQVLFASLIVMAIVDVGACLIVNHILLPRSRGELLVVLFFVTLIVVFAIVAVVFPILFPPTISL